MPLLIRPALPDDYPSIASIHNAQNEPDFHVTPERLRATYAGETEPGRYWTLLHVREGHRHQGVDVGMLHHAIREAPAPVRELWTCIREDFVPAAGFLEPERFEERFRSWGAHLDLGTFDPTRFAPLLHELARSGIRLVGSHDLAGDPERDRRLVDLQRLLEDDALAFESVIPWRHDDVTSPDTILDATVVAVAPDGRTIGIASLVGDAVGANLGCGFTGVDRPYRNRGIATALKAHTAQIAQSIGCRELNAGGGGVDTPILRVNRKLGFETEPAWITFASLR